MLISMCCCRFVVYVQLTVTMTTVGEGKSKRYVSFRASKHELEAIKLEELGKKALKRIAIISRTSKYEDAVVYFQQAADLYKADQKCRFSFLGVSSQVSAFHAFFEC